MHLTGNNFVAGIESADGIQTFHGNDPARSRELEPGFFEATPGEIDRACTAAAEAFRRGRKRPFEQTAQFLEAVADEIMGLGEMLLQRASLETGLPVDPRLIGERTRTVNQLRMFAAIVREGSWVEARIDTAQPDRKPVAKPDLRQMLIPLGPVAVFGASNFPFAYSVAGGDTASALAAGCPVIVKAHPAHPGTSELTTRAILAAMDTAGIEAGWFSMVHGPSPETGMALVKHAAIQAVGFTGSLRGGRALFDAAAARPEPIPVYAEMGSTNPIFILPGAMRERGDAIAKGLQQSVTNGAGQFCTKPGIVIGLQDASRAFSAAASRLIAEVAPQTMLHTGIRDLYQKGAERLTQQPGVAVASRNAAVESEKTQGGSVVFSTDAEAFLDNPVLGEEVFGPATLMVQCDTIADMERVARNLHGQLTASLHGTPEDLKQAKTLLDILEQKAGRVIINGFPTGVEVCTSMVHGGPYPATTASRTTSVGGPAIRRFTRPICYQNCPAALLPDELQDDNVRRIWRTVDDQFTRSPIHSS